MPYLIAYDIADPKRLHRVARFLERRATRTQKSVFHFRGDRAAVVALLDELTALLDASVDVVQAWPLPSGANDPALARGTPLPVQPAGLVIAPRQHLFVAPEPTPEPDTSPLPVSPEENLS